MIEFVSWLKDWGALVLAGVAIAISLWSLTQKWRYHPKPWIRGGMVLEDERTLRYWVQNEGTGDALALTIQLKLGKSLATLNDARKVGPNGGVSDYLILGSTDWHDDRGNLVRGVEATDPAGSYLIVRWRQTPNVKIPRSSRIRLSSD